MDMGTPLPCGHHFADRALLTDHGVIIWGNVTANGGGMAPGHAGQLALPVPRRAVVGPVAWQCQPPAIKPLL